MKFHLLVTLICFLAISATAQNVGIGTPTPASKLHVKGTGGGTQIIVEETGGSVLRVSNEANAAGPYIGTTSNHTLSLVSNNAVRATIATNGNVGIGTTSPTQKLEVNGAIKIADANSTPAEGTIRFNPANKDFEGFDGTRWLSLTATGSGFRPKSDTSTTAAANDQMGFAVKIVEPFVFVGVPYEDVGLNANQGTLKIFKKSDVSGTYEFLQSIKAADGAANDQFGSSVDAVAGDFFGFNCTANNHVEYILVVGAPGRNTNQGAIYTFRLGDNTNNQFVQSMPAITAADGAQPDYFGASVSMYGNHVNEWMRILVGAPGKIINTNLYQGKAYLYRFEVAHDIDCELNTIKLEKSYVDATGTMYSYFGSSTAIATGSDNGPTYIVSAPQKTIGANGSQGAVFVYNSNSPDTVLTNSDGDASDNFGSSLAYNAKNLCLIVGASGKENGAAGSAGAVYVFKDSSYVIGLGTTREKWLQAAKITAPDGATSDNFGIAVDFQQNVLLIGASGSDATTTDAGAVYVYEKAGTYLTDYNFIYRKKITDANVQATSRLGKKISLSADAKTYVFGVPDWDLPGKTNAGKIITGAVAY